MRKHEPEAHSNFGGLALLAACSGQSDDQQAQSASTQQTEAKASGEWVLHGQNGGEQRHSPLALINKDNVSEVGLAFSYDDFIVRGRTYRGTQSTP